MGEARTGRDLFGVHRGSRVAGLRAHLDAVLGEEGAGIGLHGELQAGGIPPERAAPEEQVGSPVLAAAVAFAKEVWAPEGQREAEGEGGRVSAERRGGGERAGL